VYVVRLPDDFDRADRDVVLAKLRGEGIGCRNYFTPIHLQPFYADSMGFSRGDYPITEHVSDRTIALPFFNRLTESQVDFVCNALRGAINSHKGAAAVMGCEVV
jgi:perosamine synthetase